jgi:hypothetical protein
MVYFKRDFGCHAAFRGLLKSDLASQEPAAKTHQFNEICGYPCGKNRSKVTQESKKFAPSLGPSGKRRPSILSIINELRTFNWRSYRIPLVGDPVSSPFRFCTALQQSCG